MPRKDRSFKTWKMVLPPTDKLPEGRAKVTLADRSLWKRLRSPVQSIYITIPSLGDLVARTETYDNERVIVEYDADGKVMGLELLSCISMSRTPEVQKALKRKNHSLLFCASFYTAHHLWHDVALALRVAAEMGAKDPKPRLLRRANPESTTWQEDPRSEPLACGA